MKKITFTISAHVRAEQSFLIPDELEINTSDLSRTYKDVLAFNGLCEHHNVLHIQECEPPLLDLSYHN